MSRVVLITILFLLGCAPNTANNVQPTPFIVGKTKVEVVGCEQLKKEVEEWNRNHPDNPRVADC